nr:DNA topoisomerase [Angustibacter aerolatus]
MQSVATRLVVERERERMAFRSASYWDLTGTFAPEADAEAQFAARLRSVDGTRVATGGDFDDRGQAKTANLVHLDQPAAVALREALVEAPVQVSSVDEKPYTRRPAAPFTTSTLQQEASRKLRFTARHTMRVAQSLYENGFITYMRTDSTVLSSEALGAARSQAAEPVRPRVRAGVAAAVRQQVQERAGGARGGAPGGRPLPHPGAGLRAPAR